VTTDPAPTAAKHGQLSRVLRTLAWIAASCFLVWLLLAYVLFYDPPLGTADNDVDAVVVLAGAASERLAVGETLVEEGTADELVLSSTGLPGNAATEALCAEEEAEVMCFTPDPLTTRGEARAIADLARERGWDSIIVVTSTYHVTRASSNISHCSKASVTMVASQPDLDALEWLGRFVEESVALVASFVRPACANSV
jgi:uncharacterized SAM-binding protein YcdF (DUF218 family)